jgi:hypothetical protein
MKRYTSADLRKDAATLIANANGDGGDKPVSEKDLVAFKNEIEQICKDAAHGWWQRRMVSDNTRFAIWDGQSEDGRKHSESMGGKPAFPFEGASDMRIRRADQFVNERVLICLAAALGARIDIKSNDAKQPALGSYLNTILQWVLKEQLDADWVFELSKLANYTEGDSPGGAVLWITWEQDWGLGMERMDLTDITEALAEMGVPEEQLMDHMVALEAMLMDPARDAESVGLLMELVPDIKEARAKVMVKDLRDEGVTEFPQSYLRLNRPQAAACRLYEDIFIPSNTSKYQKARCIFFREWIDEVDLKSRINSRGYSEAWVDEVLKHEGDCGFIPYERTGGVQGDGAMGVTRSKYDKEASRGLYEVVTCFYRAVNEDNVPGIYMLPFHCSVEFPATDRILCDYEHGEYPGVYFAREYLTNRLIDSRGVPELMMTDQYAEKLLSDAFNDNASLSVLPPIGVPRNRPDLRVVWGPLAKIKESRPGEVNLKEVPPYPAAADKASERLRMRMNEYFGRMSAEVPPDLQRLIQQGMVTFFLANLKVAIRQILQLCQQYLTDEDLQMITGVSAVQIPRGRADIQGRFNVTIEFSVGNLSMEYLQELVAQVTQVLGMDVLNVVQRDHLVRFLLNALNPSLAEVVLRPTEEASAEEIKDEKNNLALIASGQEPEMVAEGQNFALRLQVIQEALQKNPKMVEGWDETKQQILQARMEHLQNQTEQAQNAVTGRRVGKTVLGG